VAKRSNGYNKYFLFCFISLFYSFYKEKLSPKEMVLGVG
jgi:hypothetical protein